MFANCSNHPIENWSEKQVQAAEAAWGKGVNVPFPNVPPEAGEREIGAIAAAYASAIRAACPAPTAVVLQGEMTLVLETLLRISLVPAYAATTERRSHETTVGGTVVKTTVFEFVRFRRYPPVERFTGCGCG